MIERVKLEKQPVSSVDYPLDLSHLRQVILPQSTGVPDIRSVNVTAVPLIGSDGTEPDTIMLIEYVGRKTVAQYHESLFTSK